MILDPRLVPWGAVAPGVIVAATFSIAAMFMRRRGLALSLIAAAPIAGWFTTSWIFQGFPDFLPDNPTLWAFPFAVVGALLSIVGFRKPGCQGCIAGIARLIYMPALWLLVFRPVFEWGAGSLAWKILAFALIGTGIVAMYARRAGRWPSAEYAPWLAALAAASVCLSLTGTAVLGTMALALCLATIPAAIVVLATAFRGGSFLADDDDSTEDVGVKRRSLFARRRPQGLTLPLAFAVPALMCSGPLYASTTWGVACLVLAAPVAGFFGLRGMEYYVKRRNARWPARLLGWKDELLAVLIALVAAALPASIAVYMVMSAAAASDPFY